MKWTGASALATFAALIVVVSPNLTERSQVSGIASYDGIGLDSLAAGSSEQGIAAAPLQIDHCGTISSDEIWSSAGNVHTISCDLTVAIGTTLTITEGAIVKLNSSTNLFVGGDLVVQGTAGNPVYFTSYRDDSIGGDTNGDGPSTGQWGDWVRIEFMDTIDDAKSRIEYAVIQYGGRCCSPDYGSITLSGASPTIVNTEFHESDHCPIIADLSSFPIVSGITEGNNNRDGMCFRGGTVNEDGTWDVTDMVISPLSDVTIAVGKTLTIRTDQEADIVVKAGTGTSLIVDGDLVVQGTAAHPVYFTSYYDDTVGGDTGDDGPKNGGVGNPGDWQSIEFMGTIDDAKSKIEYAVIRNAGNEGPNYGAVTVVDASPTIQNTVLTNNTHAGIRTSNSTPMLLCNEIFDNSDYGLFNATAGTPVDAEGQWWGSSSGPFHAVANPAGAGNEVSDGVDFDPWQTTPCFTASSPDNVQASDGTYRNRVHVSWDAVGVATYYEVYRDTDSGGGSKSLEASPASNSYSDTSVANMVTYYYWVKACSAGGCSGFSASDSGFADLSASTEIFSDGFESSDTSAWSGVNTGDGDLTVCPAGAMGGTSHGICISINSTKRKQVWDSSPTDEVRYRSRFYFDPNGLSLGDNEKIRIAQARTGMNATRPFIIQLRVKSGAYEIRIRAKNDSNTISYDSAWYAISDDVHVIEVDWQASSGPGADDGYLSLYLDDVLKGTVGGMDTDTLVVNTLKMGFTSRVGDKTIVGTYYMDEFVSDSDAKIGP